MFNDNADATFFEIFLCLQKSSFCKILISVCKRSAFQKSFNVTSHFFCLFTRKKFNLSFLSLAKFDFNPRKKNRKSIRSAKGELENKKNLNNKKARIELSHQS